MRTYVLGILVALLVTNGAFAGSVSSVDSIVASLYPKRLSDGIARTKAAGYSDPRTQAWAALTQSGDVVAAAYASHGDGEVELIRISGNSGTVISDFYTVGMGEDTPSIQTVDLNGDGKLDFIVTFVDNQGRDNQSWVFLFDGSTMKSVTPTFGDGGFSILTSPWFFDVDGDGVVELMDQCDPDWVASRHLVDDEDVWGCLYRLAGGVYNPTNLILWMNYGNRGAAAKPPSDASTFYAQVPSATLLLVNGPKGAPRASAADVMLNGEQVIAPNDLNQNVQHVSVPVTLLTNGQPNTITRTVYGKPNAGIGLIIYVAEPSVNSNAPVVK